MPQITLGITNDQKALRLDIAQLLQGGAFVTASSGQGKSYLLRKLIEQVIAKVQVVILDPEGEFATLREKFPLLLVGQGGEVAAETRSARLLARKLVELKLSAIIDLYSLDDWLDRRAYVAEFLGGLMNVPKTLYHPILVVIDEAHMFAPKAEGTGAARERQVTAECLRAMNVLSSAGRKRGFRNVLASQRISQIHNMAIADLKTRFIGGITLPNDQSRAADELGLVTKPERVALRDLAPGEFWCYGPAINLKGVQRFKVGMVETTHPTAGEHALSAPPPTPEAIKKLAQALADLPAEAQAEQDTLDKTRTELVEAERELRQIKNQLAASEKMRQALANSVTPEPVSVFKDGEVKALTDAVAYLGSVAKMFEEPVSYLTATAKAARDAAAVVQLAITNRPIPVRHDPAIKTTHLPASMLSGTGFVMTPALDQALGTVRLKLAERRILTVLAQRGPRTKRQIAVQTGYALKGGGFINALGAMRTAGYVMSHGASDLIQITQAGERALGAYEVLPTGEALLTYWYGQLKLAERTVLTVLAAHYPSDMDIQTLAELAGYKPGTGGYNNALGKLRTLQLIGNVGPGRVKLSDELVG